MEETACARRGEKLSWAGPELRGTEEEAGGRGRRRAGPRGPVGGGRAAGRQRPARGGSQPQGHLWLPASRHTSPPS